MGSAPLMRRAVKAAAATVLHYTGLRTALAAVRRSQAGGRRVLILAYHRVVADFTGEVQRSIPGTLISVETFRRHLEDASAAGFAFASLGEALDVMAGRRRSGRDLCVITFDDGYRDTYRYAFPVLQTMGIPAIMYLPSGFVGTDRRFDHDRLYHLLQVTLQRRHRPIYETLPPFAAQLLEPVRSGAKSPSAALDDLIGQVSATQLRALIDALERQLGGGRELIPEYGDVMDWGEVRKMAANGIDLGAHTVNHVVLTQLEPGTAAREIIDSKATLERELGRPVLDFAYPNGWYSDEVIAALVKAGYRSAVTTEDLPNRISGDPYALKRKVLWENFSAGPFGYSSSLTGCHLDDVFGQLGVTRPMIGKRPVPHAASMGDLAFGETLAQVR